MCRGFAGRQGQINNDNNGQKTGDLTAEFSKYNTISCEFGSVAYGFSYSDTKADISITASIDAANYFDLPVSLYGKNILLKLGDSTYWPIVINQDYDYGY